MDAVIVAGGRRPHVQIGGRTLLQRVLDACGASRSVGRVVVAGVASREGLDAPEETLFLPDAGSLVHNVLAGARALRPANTPRGHFLAIASDLPLLTGSMLDWLCGSADDPALDFYYTVLGKDVMLARFPGAKRTFHRMKDGEFCGGDAQVLSFRLIDRVDPMLTRLVAHRKNLLRLAWQFGPGFLMRFAAGRVTHEEICNHVADRLGIRGRVLVSPYAEIGMDVDKPADLRAVMEAGGFGS